MALSFSVTWKYRGTVVKSGAGAHGLSGPSEARERLATLYLILTAKVSTPPERQVSDVQPGRDRALQANLEDRFFR